MMGHFARDCRRINEGKGRWRRRQGLPKGEGKTVKGAGKGGSDTSGGDEGGPLWNRKAGDAKDNAGRAVESYTKAAVW